MDVIERSSVVVSPLSSFIYWVLLQCATPADLAPLQDSLFKFQVDGDGTGGPFNEISKKVPNSHRFADIFKLYLESSGRLAKRPFGLVYANGDSGFRSDAGPLLLDSHEGDSKGYGHQLSRNRKRKDGLPGYGGKRNPTRDDRGKRSRRSGGKHILMHFLAQGHPGKVWSRFQTTNQLLDDAPGKALAAGTEEDHRGEDRFLLDGPAAEGDSGKAMGMSDQGTETPTTNSPAEDVTGDTIDAPPGYGTHYKLRNNPGEGPRKLDGSYVFHKGLRLRKTRLPYHLSNAEDLTEETIDVAPGYGTRYKLPNVIKSGDFYGFHKRLRLGETSLPYLSNTNGKTETDDGSKIMRSMDNSEYLSKTGKNWQLLKQGAINSDQPMKEPCTETAQTTVMEKSFSLESPKSLRENSYKVINETVESNTSFKKDAVKDNTAIIKQDKNYSTRHTQLQKRKREARAVEKFENDTRRYPYVIAGLGSLSAILLVTLAVVGYKTLKQPGKANYERLVPDFKNSRDSSEKNENGTTYVRPGDYDLKKLHKSPYAIQKTAKTSEKLYPIRTKSKIPVLKRVIPVQSGYQRIRCVETPSLETIQETEETNISEHEIGSNSNFSLFSYKMKITRGTNKPNWEDKGTKDFTPSEKRENVSVVKQRTGIKQISYNSSKISAKERRKFSKKDILPSTDKSNSRVLKHENETEIINFKRTVTHDIKEKIPKNHKENVLSTTSKRIPNRILNFNGCSATEKTTPYISMKEKGETVERPKNRKILQTDYPEMLNPFKSDPSIVEIGDDSEFSDVSMEYSEALDSFSDISDPMELSGTVENDAQDGKCLQSNLECRKAEPEVFSKQYPESETAETGSKRISSGKSDLAARKRLLQLHHRIAAKGFCGPTGVLK